MYNEENIRELGANVACLASIAFDEAGSCILKQLSDLEVENNITTSSEKTTIKERIIAEPRKVQMLRLDSESVTIPGYHQVMDKLHSLFLPYNMIVISDYAKGMITEQLMNYVRLMKIPTIIDPKPVNLGIYGYSFLMTPNEKETKEMGGAKNILRNNAQYVLETKGQKGMTLHDVDFSKDISAERVEIYNVSGAGDTVVAVMAVCLSIGIPILDAAQIANKCAGYVVTQPETSVVPNKIFLDILKKTK